MYGLYIQGVIYNCVVFAAMMHFSPRYKDGEDYIGEHQDNERDLDPLAPIASLSLGRTRDFVFKHESAKRKHKTRPPDTETLKIELKHGSLLVMNYPTNKHWYHSLPPRKSLLGVRVNMTFRRLKPENTRNTNKL